MDSHRGYTDEADTCWQQGGRAYSEPAHQSGTDPGGADSRYGSTAYHDARQGAYLTYEAGQRYETDRAYEAEHGYEPCEVYDGGEVFEADAYLRTQTTQVTQVTQAATPYRGVETLEVPAPRFRAESLELGPGRRAAGGVAGVTGVTGESAYAATEAAYHAADTDQLQDDSGYAQAEPGYQQTAAYYHQRESSYHEYAGYAGAPPEPEVGSATASHGGLDPEDEREPFAAPEPTARATHGAGGQGALRRRRGAFAVGLAAATVVLELPMLASFASALPVGTDMGTAVPAILMTIGLPCFAAGTHAAIGHAGTVPDAANWFRAPLALLPVALVVFLAAALAVR